MTAWEYRSIQVRTVPVASVGRSGEHPIGERLTKLGSEGWELTGVALTDDPAWSVLLFKRAISGTIAPGIAARDAVNGVAAAVSP